MVPAILRLSAHLRYLLECVAVSVLICDSLTHVVFQIAMDVLLPEFAQAVTLAVRYQTFSLNLKPEG